MWMALSERQIKIHAAVACLGAAMMLGAAGSCFAQTDDTAPADVEVASPIIASEVPAQPQCLSVVLSCNTPSRSFAPEHQLLDPATARDQAQRAQAQADQTAAEKDLQQRIEFARQHPNAIFVYGNKSTPTESVSDAFNRALGVTATTMTTSSFDSMGRRTECVSACRGPFCCITTPSAIDNGK
jgi:hypothetical protein